jgi:predicted nucleic acid-binding protein
MAIFRMNYGEIVYGTHKEAGWSEDSKRISLEVLDRLPLERVSVPDELIDTAVGVKSRHAISYADAFAAALAIQRAIPLVSGDPDFRPLEADGLLQLYWVGA